MARYTKETAISIICNCAKKYKEELAGRCLLFVCMDKHKKISYMEVSFYASNFLHLTGVKLVKQDMSALDFFEHCISHKLSKSMFEFAEDGTTQLKLEILPLLMCKNLSANAIGDFFSYNPKLYTEKLAGSQKACMGFVKGKETSEYHVPNTVLHTDIRNHITKPLRIIETYRKNRKRGRDFDVGSFSW